MKSYEFDSLKFATEGLTGMGCTVVQDDANLPSFMVPIAKRTNAQLFTGGSQKTHSAFIVDDVEYPRFLASKFINCIVNGRAYSWPGVDPAASLNYDAAMTACNAKGTGFHLLSIPERAVINHLIYKSGFVPGGNTNYGANYKKAYEVGVPSMALDSSGRVQRTATGSGPATWCHDGTREGIADWVGDIHKWFSGMRIKDGEIQIFSSNLAAKQVSAADASTYWKAILQDGSLVDPGTANTLKYTGTPNVATVVSGTAGNTPFKSLAAASGVTIPEILKELHLFPVADDSSNYEGYIYINAEGERLPVGGSGWYDASNSGPSRLYLISPRSYVNADIGFFSAFMEL